MLIRWIKKSRRKYFGFRSVSIYQKHQIIHSQCSLSESYLNKAIKIPKVLNTQKLSFLVILLLCMFLGLLLKILLVQWKKNTMMSYCASLLIPRSVTSFWHLETGHCGDLPGVKVRWLLQQKHTMTYLARALDRPESTRKLATNL